MIDQKIICDACGRVISHREAKRRKYRFRYGRRVKGKHFWVMREADIDLCYKCRPRFEPLFSLMKKMETDFNNVEKKYYQARDRLIENVRAKAKAIGQTAPKKKVVGGTSSVMSKAEKKRLQK